jgi:outer membrane scaffolding protein for murein synthesis (MipA/OmpV family)
MSSGRWSCAVVCCLVLVSWCAGAADEVEDGDKRTIYLGAGALISTQPYKGVDARIYAVPLFAYEGKRLYVRGIVGGYRLYSIGDWSVGPVIQPRFEGYEEQDSPFLNGMDDRDWSLDGGVGTSLLTKYGLFGLSFVTDLLGRHNGQELEFSYTILFELAGFELIPLEDGEPCRLLLRRRVGRGPGGTSCLRGE